MNQSRTNKGKILFLLTYTIGVIVSLVVFDTSELGGLLQPDIAHADVPHYDSTGGDGGGHGCGSCSGAGCR